MMDLRESQPAYGNERATPQSTWWRIADTCRSAYDSLIHVSPFEMLCLMPPKESVAKVFKGCNDPQVQVQELKETVKPSQLIYQIIAPRGSHSSGKNDIVRNDKADIIKEDNIVQKEKPVDIVEKQKPVDIIEKQKPVDIVEKQKPVDIVEKQEPVDIGEKEKQIDIYTAICTAERVHESAEHFTRGRNGEKATPQNLQEVFVVREPYERKIVRNKPMVEQSQNAAIVSEETTDEERSCVVYRYELELTLIRMTLRLQQQQENVPKLETGQPAVTTEPFVLGPSTNVTISKTVIRITCIVDTSSSSCLPCCDGDQTQQSGGSGNGECTTQHQQSQAASASSTAAPSSAAAASNSSSGNGNDDEDDDDRKNRYTGPRRPLDKDESSNNSESNSQPNSGKLRVAEEEKNLSSLKPRSSWQPRRGRKRKFLPHGRMTRPDENMDEIQEVDLMGALEDFGRTRGRSEPAIISREDSILFESIRELIGPPGSSSSNQAHWILEQLYTCVWVSAGSTIRCLAPPSATCDLCEWVMELFQHCMECERTTEQRECRNCRFVVLILVVHVVFGNDVRHQDEPNSGTGQSADINDRNSGPLTEMAASSHYTSLCSASLCNHWRLDCTICRLIDDLLDGKPASAETLLSILNPHVAQELLQKIISPCQRSSRVRFDNSIGTCIDSRTSRYAVSAPSLRRSMSHFVHSSRNQPLLSLPAVLPNAGRHADVSLQYPPNAQLRDPTNTHDPPSVCGPPSLDYDRGDTEDQPSEHPTPFHQSLQDVQEDAEEHKAEDEIDHGATAGLQTSQSEPSNFQTGPQTSQAGPQTPQTGLQTSQTSLQTPQTSLQTPQTGPQTTQTSLQTTQTGLQTSETLSPSQLDRTNNNEDTLSQPQELQASDARPNTSSKRLKSSTSSKLDSTDNIATSTRQPLEQQTSDPYGGARPKTTQIFSSRSDSQNNNHARTTRQRAELQESYVYGGAGTQISGSDAANNNSSTDRTSHADNNTSYVYDGARPKISGFDAANNNSSTDRRSQAENFRSGSLRYSSIGHSQNFRNTHQPDSSSLDLYRTQLSLRNHESLRTLSTRNLREIASTGRVRYVPQSGDAAERLLNDVEKRTLPNGLTEGIIDENYREGLVIIEGEYREGEEWSLGDRLGGGTFGVVFRAEDSRSGFVFCVKKVPMGKHQKEECVLLSRLSSPHVMRCYGALLQDGHVLFLFELLTGETLKEFICPTGCDPFPVPVDVALRLMRQLVLVEQHHAEQGLIHGDLKPENIMLRDQGEEEDEGDLQDIQLVVVDYGTARAVGPPNHTLQTNELLGSVPEMSPEKVRGEEVGHPSEVWAIAAIFLFLINGIEPYLQRFTRTTKSQLLYMIGKAPNTILADIPSLLPVEVQDLLQCMLRSEPGERLTHREIFEHRAFELLTSMPPLHSIFLAPLPSYAKEIYREDRDGPKTTPEVEPANQTVNQPTSLPSNQSGNQPTNLPSNQSVNMHSNQSVDQPTSLPSNQPASLPSNQSVNQPASLPANQSVNMLSNQSGNQPTNLPSNQSVNMLSNQSVDQPTSLPSNQPTSIPSNQFFNQPLNQPAYSSGEKSPSEVGSELPMDIQQEHENDDIEMEDFCVAGQPALFYVLPHSRSFNLDENENTDAFGNPRNNSNHQSYDSTDGKFDTGEMRNRDVGNSRHSVRTASAPIPITVEQWSSPSDSSSSPKSAVTVFTPPQKYEFTPPHRSGASIERARDTAIPSSVGSELSASFTRMQLQLGNPLASFETARDISNPSSAGSDHGRSLSRVLAQNPHAAPSPFNLDESDLRFSSVDDSGDKRDREDTQFNRDQGVGAGDGRNLAQDTRRPRHLSTSRDGAAPFDLDKSMLGFQLSQRESEQRGEGDTKNRGDSSAPPFASFSDAVNNNSGSSLDLRERKISLEGNAHRSLSRGSSSAFNLDSLEGKILPTIPRSSSSAYNLDTSEYAPKYSDDENEDDNDKKDVAAGPPSLNSTSSSAAAAGASATGPPSLNSTSSATAIVAASTSSSSAATTAATGSPFSLGKRRGVGAGAEDTEEVQAGEEGASARGGGTGGANRRRGLVRQDEDEDSDEEMYAPTTDGKACGTSGCTTRGATGGATEGTIAALKDEATARRRGTTRKVSMSASGYKYESSSDGEDIYAENVSGKSEDPGVSHQNPASGFEGVSRRVVKFYNNRTELSRIQITHGCYYQTVIDSVMHSISDEVSGEWTCVDEQGNKLDLASEPPMNSVINVYVVARTPNSMWWVADNRWNYHDHHPIVGISDVS